MGSETEPGLFVSAQFIEDATFFIASIIPLVYVFEGNPALLACSVHVLSVPCAGIGHSARLSGPQTFALILAQTLMLLVDTVVCLFCVCQFMLSDMCCETLAAAGISCLAHFQDVPLAVILLPISLFNIMRGSLRFMAIFRASAGISDTGLALNASVKAVHLSILLYASADDDYARLLSVAQLYGIFSVLLAAANWKGYSEQALVTCFFADYAILTLHTRNTLMHASPTIGMFLAYASLSVSSLLLLSNPRYAESGDGWAKALTVVVSVAFSYVAFAEWTHWAALEGCLLVAYFGTAVLRCFIFGGDSLLNTRVAAVAFALIDVTAVVGIVAGDVIVKPDLYAKIISADAWHLVSDPQNYVKVINALKYEKIVDGGSTIIDAATYESIADKESYAPMFQVATYKKIVDNAAFKKLSDPDTYKLLIEPDIYKWAFHQLGLSASICIGCILLLLIVTLFVLYETNQRLSEQWKLISREVDAAKAMSREYWQDDSEARCTGNSEKLSKVGHLFENVEQQATMLAMASSLDLDNGAEKLRNDVVLSMSAKMENKDVWFKVVFIKGVTCSLRQRAQFVESETSPKMLADLADALEEGNMLRQFNLSPEMFASDPAGECGKCRVEHGVFKMLHYAATQIGIAETKRTVFIISAKRSYAKATDFERKAVVWKVAYS